MACSCCKRHQPPEPGVCFYSTVAHDLTDGSLVWGRTYTVWCDEVATYICAGSDPSTIAVGHGSRAGFMLNSVYYEQAGSSAGYVKWDILNTGTGAATSRVDITTDLFEKGDWSVRDGALYDIDLVNVPVLGATLWQTRNGAIDSIARIDPTVPDVDWEISRSCDNFYVLGDLVGFADGSDRAFYDAGVLQWESPITEDFVAESFEEDYWSDTDYGLGDGNTYDPDATTNRSYEFKPVPVPLGIVGVGSYTFQPDGYGIETFPCLFDVDSTGDATAIGHAWLLAVRDDAMASAYYSRDITLVEATEYGAVGWYPVYKVQDGTASTLELSATRLCLVTSASSVTTLGDICAMSLLPRRFAMEGAGTGAVLCQLNEAAQCSGNNGSWLVYFTGGAVTWIREIVPNISVGSHPALAIGPDSHVYLSYTDQLFSLDKDTGDLRWAVYTAERDFTNVTQHQDIFFSGSAAILTGVVTCERAGTEIADAEFYFCEINVSTCESAGIPNECDGACQFEWEETTVDGEWECNGVGNLVCHDDPPGSCKCPSGYTNWFVDNQGNEIDGGPCDSSRTYTRKCGRWVKIEPDTCDCDCWAPQGRGDYDGEIRDGYCASDGPLGAACVDDGEGGRVCAGVMTEAEAMELSGNPEWFEGETCETVVCECVPGEGEGIGDGVCCTGGGGCNDQIDKCDCDDLGGTWVTGPADCGVAGCP